MFSRCCIFETLRTIKNIKHVRLKSSNIKLKESVTVTEDMFQLRTDILCEILNCNIYTAQEIIAKQRHITDFNTDDFRHNAKFVKKYFKLSDVVEYPYILTLQPSLLQHRYFSLKELGFRRVNSNYILRFSHILKETPQALKRKGYPVTCEYKSDILSEYLSASKMTEIDNKLQHMFTDGSNLQKIREVMNAEYFAAKLECSIGKAHQMLHKCAALRVQSISNTNQLLNVLLYKFGLSFSKIFSSLYLLSVHHEMAEQFLTEFPEILNVSTLFLIRRLPMLLKQENRTIHEVENILKDFKINMDQLICCPKVLLIAPSTLQKRLTFLCNTEDFSVLKSNKKFLWLVYYYSSLNSRFKYLKAENMPCSISMFTASKSKFKKYLLYNNTRPCIRETFGYLAEVFKMNEKEIFNRLRHCSYIQTVDQNFSTLNCRNVLEFLLLSGITKEQIFNGLEIVLYDIDTVKTHFNSLKTHPQCQPYEEWISHAYLIQLLIYTIEVVKYHSYHVETAEQGDLFLEYVNKS